MYRNPWRPLQMRLIGFGIIMPVSGSFLLQSRAAPTNAGR
jgi:hypothetical protein